MNKEVNTIIQEDRLGYESKKQSGWNRFIMIWIGYDETWGNGSVGLYPNQNFPSIQHHKLVE